MKRITKIFGILMILTVLLALPFAALAAPAGKISFLEGNVDITAGGKARDAKPGDPVSVGDILRAKSKSRAEVTFLDGNILRLAENTRVRITDYRPGEGKTTTLDLFRGKTQNIVSGLAKNARYEIQTPTAIVGVRGTDFIAFFQNGVSGFLPKEGTIYGYNRAMPKDIKVVTPGQAIMVLAADKPPVIQPATSADVDKHMKDTAPGEKKDEKEKDKKKEEGPAAPPAAPPPPPPPPPPTTVPVTIPTTVATTVQTTISTTVATTVPIVSGTITDGKIMKMVTGTIRVSDYASLYKIPAGAKPHSEFYSAGGNNYLRLRYEDMYFDDGIGVNRGYRYEKADYIGQASPADVWKQEKQRWYWPNQFFVTLNHDGNVEGVRDRGRTYELLPNLDLSAVPTNGGGNAATHPLFYGTLGNAASFPADYAVGAGSPGTGTFVKTADWTLAGVTSREQIGTLTGALGILGSDPMRLWSSSTAANPVGIALKGAFTHDAGYEGSAFRGTVGFNGTIDQYVQTTTGYGGAYYGQVSGNLPDTGSTMPVEGKIIALYIYSPDSTTNKAGVITGGITPGSGTTVPETGAWQAEGTMNRLTPLEIENTSGITAANLSANIIGGRAMVQATAGFYNPTGAPKVALGMGHGWMPTITGINSFGLFSLGHGFVTRHENASTQTTWESAGWGEFGRYTRTDNPAWNYRDYGLWYADLNSNKSWAGNQLAADFNGRFLTLLKYGKMTGKTTGAYYSDSSVWGASSQGYWQQSGDLGFASEIHGNTSKLVHQAQRTFSSGSSLYQYWITDPRSGERSGDARSYYYDAANNRTTIQNFDIVGPHPGDIYRQETWTTADGGATWSYAGAEYPDETAYRAAADGLAKPPPGTWDALPAGDRYELRNEYHFGGIMGGLNANLWTDGKSPLKFLGNYGDMGKGERAPWLASGEITSVNPLATSNAFANSELKIGGAYRGVLGVAADSTNALTGGLTALYRDNAGTGGVLYSNDIKGTGHPQVGAWEADGTINVYPMTSNPLTGDPKLFAGSIVTEERVSSLASGQVPVDVISGGSFDRRTGRSAIQWIPTKSWGIWNGVWGGTYTGSPQGRWIERTEGNLTAGGDALYNYWNYDMGAPANDISTGTMAGVEARFDLPSQENPSVRQSFTVVKGGIVKNLFDPATPNSWMSVGMGGFMETSALMAKNAVMDDAAKANFEKAMKIPAFDVGTANLRGNDGNLSVNMDGIKFFRFRTETDPRIWATGTVYGSYTSNPVAATAGAPGTTVQLTSSGDLTGLKHTFEVKQWNAGGNNNWGAAVYRGAADTGGTLTRSSADAARATTGYLPAGAAATIPITELRGGAAGTIRPGVSIPGLSGPNSFVGTAAGTVR